MVCETFMVTYEYDKYVRRGTVVCLSPLDGTHSQACISSTARQQENLKVSWSAHCFMQGQQTNVHENTLLKGYIQVQTVFNSINECIALHTSYQCTRDQTGVQHTDLLILRYQDE